MACRKSFKKTLPQKNLPTEPQPVPPAPEPQWPRIWLEQVNLVGVSGPQQILTDARGRIVEIVSQAEAVAWSADYRLNCPWEYVSLPGLDLQINGVLGLSYLYVNVDDEYGFFRLEQTCRFLAEAGVSGFLPTLVTSPLGTIQRALKAFRTFLDQPYEGARILGIHLEGPFLNPEKRGAHAEQCLLPLTLENVKRFLGDFGDLIKIVTLAPELDPSGTVISYLKEQGITVSLGHSQASAAQAKTAFDQGVTMLTHAFNAMPGLHHRQPGPLAAAIADPRVSYGLIADGQHVDPLMLELLIRTDRPGARGTFLVSDALAPLGLDDGVYPWDQRQITVKGGTARLPDGTLSGTTLPLLRGVDNLIKWQICPPAQAIALATIAPREAIGVSTSYLEQPLFDLLAWEQNLNTQKLEWEWLSSGQLIDLASDQDD